MARRFGSAAAFKAALEAHLRKLASERKVPFSTLQLKLVIERLLARLFRSPDPPWLLKGGFAMNLRFRPQARTTKDVDLSVALSPAGPAADFSGALRSQLQEMVDVDLRDYLTYRIGVPKQELTNVPRGGARYLCDALLVGKTYAKFQIDVGYGDLLVGEPERLTGDELLSFAGIAPVTALAISKAQQFAEKLHAYTFPWSGRLNTRTKDLVDLILLIERGTLDVGDIRSALRTTFLVRGTHPVPASLDRPPSAWAIDFPVLANEAGLSSTDYLEAFSILEAFWTDNALDSEREE